MNLLTHCLLQGFTYALTCHVGMRARKLGVYTGAAKIISIPTQGNSVVIHIIIMIKLYLDITCVNDKYS